MFKRLIKNWHSYIKQVFIVIYKKVYKVKQVKRIRIFTTYTRLNVHSHYAYTINYDSSPVYNT